MSQEESESLNRQITTREIKAVIKKTSNPQKPWDRWLHRQILLIIQRRTNTYPYQTIPKKLKKREDSQTLFMRPKLS